ncbi:HEAT repeat domain-containing protein [Clostridium formicaceticum]|uniref:HEAT repeat domain-containing protein n=1 Tax=Clostridium formicaceticum TaxID=1497 RepID=A0AAC9RMF1_9CLOT|nr:HEAT repeat domain-containing protein [Clostridium formicaceticum]AOY77783.1 hypothetical protein BJL90_19105 [Clostridium formicaceticum]ARE88389.1 hypothetical protein CLFO_27910 [Clostridium formicaceticum]
MGKRDEYEMHLKQLVSKNAFEELEDMLISNSNLPGPRGNLELAYAFGNCLKAVACVHDDLWQILNQWATVTAEETPSDGPKEFIPFCAVQALGAIFTFVDSEKKEKIIKLFRVAANDSRWRVREAVAIGLQWIEEEDFRQAEFIFNKWIDDASLLERRAIIAALAHPPVLNHKDNAEFCFEITEKILKDLIKIDKKFRKTEEFRILRKGLEYAVSVFVAKLPDEGFEFMKKWAQEKDADIRKIIKSNLGKSRLTKKFDQQVKEVLGVLTDNFA